MRIEQLEYIEAVTRLGPLRRAADELHMSQTAMSETVRNLERELAVDLLDRKRSGARISDAGRELLPHIIGVLYAVDRLRRTADSETGHRPAVPAPSRPACRPAGVRHSGGAPAHDPPRLGQPLRLPRVGSGS